MVNRVEVSPLAEKEIEESFDWYEKEAAGLGIRFILSIDEAIVNIVAKPETYPKKKSSIRQYVVVDFPFLIIFEYVEADNLVNILHVFHTSRNPKLKYKRS